MNKRFFRLKTEWAERIPKIQMQQYKDLEENLELEYLFTIEIKRNDNPYGDAYMETSQVDIFVNERGIQYDKKWIDIFYDEITK